ncbi:MAG: type IV pili methyl-accepting chemotaxis transducer N-terminal domain-containing protein [Proteobacteria bacterium]|nr:type IV pili methyl-accepting chemotaxis transducer N-terminal domain-containing protein [Pseudomonadota bacterium]
MLGLIFTAITLWVSWQLDGGAAAINEAGRMRMQAYRLAWVSTLEQPTRSRAELLTGIDRSLALLAEGDPERPLVTPWDDEVRFRYADVRRQWATLRAMHASVTPVEPSAMDRATRETVDAIDGLVQSIEKHLARYTNILHFMQVALLVASTLAAAVLVVVGYHFVLEPVVGLTRAVSSLRAGDLSARVEPSTSDELGELAAGFNDMARQLQASYTDLEQRVREKTAELQDKRERLQSLYETSLLVARCAGLQELADGFTRRVRIAARADAAVLRWTDAAREQFLLLASEGLSEDMAREEHCIRAGDCHCGRTSVDGGTRVIPVRDLAQARRMPCEQAGWVTVVAVPIHAQERHLGELDLFYRSEVTLTDAEHVLLETLTSHLASGMENLRLHALEREAAIAEERAFLARELHDSIAQSLAFLGIQAQLMRKAMADNDAKRMLQVMAEIELGLRESHGDVRELLVHFRTRTNAQDMEHALQTTLRKFEHQSGLISTLTMHDEGMPLPPDVQIQALHIVQEALSNVRKHARADHVRVDIWKRPAWRIEVHDDGQGFDPASVLPDEENHVGLRIMRERAHRLGADLRVTSHLGAGTTVALQFPVATAAETPDPARSTASVDRTVTA